MKRHSPGWDPPRKVLVLHELTPQGDNAAWRAGMLARDQGADLCLLHAASELGGVGTARRALAQLAAELDERLGVQVDVRVVQGDALDAAAQAADRTSLVVMGAPRANVLHAWIFGSPAARLMRASGRPVLVVKKPATSSYRRVLVPVDFDGDAASAVHAATALSRCTRIEVFHSLATRDEVTLRAADVPEVDVRKYRQRNAERTRARIFELIGTVPGAGFSAVPSIGFGCPSSMVLAKEQAMRADLVVIGKRRRGTLADFLLGSVTQRVLADSRSDVLVLPTAAKKTGNRLVPGGLPA